MKKKLDIKNPNDGKKSIYNINSNDKQRKNIQLTSN